MADGRQGLSVGSFGVEVFASLSQLGQKALVFNCAKSRLGQAGEGDHPHLQGKPAADLPAILLPSTPRP